MPRPLPSVQLLAETWAEWKRMPSFPFRGDHCINGTRVVCRMLQRMDVPCRPVSCSVVWNNSAAHDLTEQGVPVDEWPVHAWAVGCPDLDAPPEPGRWRGHLIAEGEGWTLDVSAGQFRRPVIPVPPVLLLPTNMPPEGRMLEARMRDGDAIVALSRLPANNGWRNAPGWKRLHEDEVAELSHRMKAHAAAAMEGVPR